MYLKPNETETKEYEVLRKRPEFPKLKKIEMTRDEMMWQKAEDRGEKRGVVESIQEF